MSSHYIAKQLTPNQIAQAFPLVEILDAGLTAEQWSDYATAFTGSSGRLKDRGIITVQNDQGVIYGLSAYWLRHDLRRGNVLEIESFATLDLMGGRSAARTLLRALEKLARRRNCSCISINLLNPHMRRWLREPHHPAVELFRAAGYRGKPMRLRKCFQAAWSPTRTGGGLRGGALQNRLYTRVDAGRIPNPFRHGAAAGV